MAESLEDHGKEALSRIVSVGVGREDKRDGFDKVTDAIFATHYTSSVEARAERDDMRDTLEVIREQTAPVEKTRKDVAKQWGPGLGVGGAIMFVITKVGEDVPRLGNALLDWLKTAN